MDTELWSIDYTSLLNEAGTLEYEKMSDFLLEELPYAWFALYRQNCLHEHNVNRFQLNTFEYIFDDCSLNASETEARLVAVLGHSSPSDKLRNQDDSRLRGWLGPTKDIFGNDWDKGHFIAHSIGGAVDRWEVNIFPQRRLINRGICEEGKLFRAMENYGTTHSGVFCFNRPLYHDHSNKPSFFEFGVLKTDSTLWVHVFDNR